MQDVIGNLVVQVASVFLGALLGMYVGGIEERRRSKRSFLLEEINKYESYIQCELGRIISFIENSGLPKDHNNLVRNRSVCLMFMKQLKSHTGYLFTIILKVNSTYYSKRPPLEIVNKENAIKKDVEDFEALLNNDFFAE